VSMKQEESRSVIRLEGESTMSSAAELKGLLLEGLASGNDLRLDLERVEEIDITVMQLLWAAGREAERRGTGITVQVSDVAALAARNAGFERFPGLTSEA